MCLNRRSIAHEVRQSHHRFQSQHFLQRCTKISAVSQLDRAIWAWRHDKDVHLTAFIHDSWEDRKLIPVNHRKDSIKVHHGVVVWNFNGNNSVKVTIWVGEQFLSQRFD